MTQMNVAMTLTMLDTASPQVKAFMVQLEALERVVASVGAKMGGLAAGFSSLRAASGEAATGLTASADATATLRSALSGMNTRLTSATERLGVLAAESKAAAASVMNLGVVAKETNLGNMFSGATSGARGLNREVNTLNQSLRGMAELWGALKIEQGFKASVNAASDFQKEMMKVQALGLSPEATARITDKAWDDSKVLKFASALDAVKARMAIIGGLAETGATPMAQSVLDQMTPAVMKAANALSLMGDKTDTVNQIRNLVAVFEARGQTDNVAAMKKSLDLVTQAYSVTGGKVLPVDFDVFFRRYGQGSLTMSDDAIRNTIALIDQMKSMGGGGQSGASSLAVALKMLQAYAIGKPMNKQGAAMLEESGIFGKDAGLNDGSTLSTNIRKGGSARDPKLAATDIVSFFAKYGPNIIAYTRRYMKEFYGKDDPNDPAAIDAAVQKYITMLGFSVTAAQALSLAVNPRSQARIAQQNEMMKQAPGVEGVNEIIKPSYAQNVKNFTAAVENLKIVLGNQLLPVLTPLVEKIAEVVGWIAKIGQGNPAVMHLAVLTAGFVGLTLAISGARKVFGVVGTLGGLMTTLGRAGTTGAAGLAAGGGAVLAAGGLFGRVGGMFAAASGVIAGAFAIIGRGFLRMLPWVGALLIAWDLAEVIGNLEVGGHKISEWAKAVGSKMLDAFFAAGKQIKEWASELADGIAKILPLMFPIPYLVSKLGGLVLDLIPGGNKIREWAAGVAEGVSGSFERMANKVSLDFKQMAINAAAAINPIMGLQLKLLSMVDGKKVEAWAFGPPKNTGGASGDWGPGGASGDWGNDPKTHSEIIRDKMMADAAGVKLGAPRSATGGGSSRRSSKFDQELSDLKQQNTLIEDEIKRHHKALAREFADKTISISDYYSQQLNDQQKLIQEQIEILRAEKDRQLKTGDQAGAARSDTQIILKTRELEDLAEKSIADKKKTLAKLTAESEKINKEYRKLTGSGLADAISEVSQKGADASAWFLLNDMAGAAEKNDALTKLKIAHLQYADALSKVKENNDALAVAEQKLNISIKAGTITALEAADALVEMRRKTAQDNLPALAIMQQTAGTPSEKRTASRDAAIADGELKALSASAIQVKNIMDGAFSGFFSNIIRGNGSLKDSFKSLFKSIEQGIADLVAKQLSQKLVNSLFASDGIGSMIGKMIGPSSTTSGASNDGWLKSIAGWVFGGGGGASMTPAQSFAAGITPMAVGTDYVPQDMLALIHKGEKIVPAAYNTPERGKSVNQYMNFNFDSPQSRETMMQIAATSGHAIQRAMARNS